MRNGVGLSTISQRLAGLAPTRPPSVRAVPGQTTFAATLADQVAANIAAVGSGAAPPDTMIPSVSPIGRMAGPTGRPPGLGQGAALSTGPSLITPELPGGAGAVAVVDHGHDDGPDHVHGPPALDRAGPPPELVAHGNGQIPATALESLGVGDHRLWSPAARAFRDMSEAAARDGVSFGINSSYRSYAKQEEMVRRYGLYSQGGRAAQPGTSNHGWGVSLDLQLGDDARAWMRANGADYGFVEDVPREPWHWTFKASEY